MFCEQYQSWTRFQNSNCYSPYVFHRSKSSLIADFFTGYIPGFVLRLAFHLSIGPLAAVFSFSTVTKQLMADKLRDFEKDEGDKPDLLSMIRVFVPRPFVLPR